MVGGGRTAATMCNNVVSRTRVAWGVSFLASYLGNSNSGSLPHGAALPGSGSAAASLPREPRSSTARRPPHRLSGSNTGPVRSGVGGLAASPHELAGRPGPGQPRGTLF